eukprot:gene2968-3421_t
MENDIAWVQCEDTKCLKWRQISKDMLPSMKNISWYCHMNQDKAKAFCEYEQEDMKLRRGEQFIFSVVEEGSLVWAKLSGYPSWPAIICSDLSEGNFASYDEDGDLKHYHVEYFGEPRSHSWVLAKNVAIYGSASAPTPSVLASCKRMSSARVRKSFEKAIMEADQLFCAKPKDRLKSCLFKVTGPLLNDSGRTSEETPSKDALDALLKDKEKKDGQSKGSRHSLTKRTLSGIDCSSIKPGERIEKKRRRSRSLKHEQKSSYPLSEADSRKHANALSVNNEVKLVGKSVYSERKTHLNVTGNKSKASFSCKASSSNRHMKSLVEQSSSSAVHTKKNSADVNGILFSSDVSYTKVASQSETHICNLSAHSNRSRISFSIQSDMESTNSSANDGKVNCGGKQTFLGPPSDDFGQGQNTSCDKQRKTVKETNGYDEEEDIIDSLMGCTKKELPRSDTNEFDVCLVEFEDLENDIKEIEESIFCMKEASPEDFPIDCSKTKNDEFTDEDLIREMEETEGLLAGTD